MITLFANQSWRQFFSSIINSDKGNSPWELVEMKLKMQQFTISAILWVTSLALGGFFDFSELPVYELDNLERRR